MAERWTWQEDWMTRWTMVWTKWMRWTMVWTKWMMLRQKQRWWEVAWWCHDGTWALWNQGENREMIQILNLESIFSLGHQWCWSSKAICLTQTVQKKAWGSSLHGWMNGPCLHHSLLSFAYTKKHVWIYYY